MPESPDPIDLHVGHHRATSLLAPTPAHRRRGLFEKGTI